MASTRFGKSLDRAFGERLILRVSVDTDDAISPDSRKYWKKVISRAHRSPMQVARDVAGYFSRREWTISEPWMQDPGIKELFDGYDRETFFDPDDDGTKVDDTKDRPAPLLGATINTPATSTAGNSAATGNPTIPARIEIPTVLSPWGKHPDPTRLPSPPYDEDLELDIELKNAPPAPTADDLLKLKTGEPDDGSVPQPLQPSKADWDQTHSYKGQQLGPIGVRLTHIKNFLVDEDVDRDITWKQRIAETEDYLLSIKNDKNTWELGEETRDMVDRLLEMVRAHKIFEEYHYGTFNSTKVITPDLINEPATRLPYDEDHPITLGGTGKTGAHKWHDLMPNDFPDQPRVQQIVNDMWLTDAEAKAGLTPELRQTYQTELSKAEDDWWQLEPNESPPAENLSVVENSVYEFITGLDSGRGFDGWLLTEPLEDGGLRRIIAGAEFLEDTSARSYARERGARRAGLQGALRQFHHMENQVACTPWRRLVLPPLFVELDQAREHAGAKPGRKWPLVSLEPHRLRKTDGKDDPQAFTVAMARFWREQQPLLREARETIINRLGARGGLAPLGAVPDKRYVTPPDSLFGPYVWRAVDSDTQNAQDMLKQMRAVKKLFDRELRVAPRQLLSHMYQMYELGYQNQGLTEGSVVFLDFDTKQDVVVDLVARRDYAEGQLLDLDKLELYWIRLILNNSITMQMTQDLEPRTSLYLVFAERLSRIFKDISDPLFGSVDDKVSVEDLLAYMHKKADGPVKKAKFYAHDAQMWLTRLALQGRCRYQDDWRCYGWVQRPLPDCHPEHLITWRIPSDELAVPSIDAEDMVFAPHVQELRSWADVIKDGAPPQELHKDVANYFQCLAYRWGRYMHTLENPENGLENEWKTRPALPVRYMQGILTACEEEYHNLADWKQKEGSWDNNPLVSLVKRVLPAKANDATVDPAASIQTIREHVINEAVRNDSMLWPARHTNDIYDEHVRPPLWDWAKPSVRGPVKKFFDMNRWPLQLQNEDQQRRIRADEDLSAQQLYNPVTEDPTPWTYYRPKARPYADEKTKFRAGHRMYPLGDTPRQKKALENQLYATIGRAMGVDGNQRPSLWGRVSSLFTRGDDDSDDDDDWRGLQPVDPRDIPKSYDPREEANKKRKADKDSQRGSRKAARSAIIELSDDSEEEMEEEEEEGIDPDAVDKPGSEGLSRGVTGGGGDFGGLR